MRMFVTLLIAALCVSAALDQSHAQASCSGNDGLDVTCVPLTGALLMSLRLASRRKVVDALQASGETMSGGGLHFRSIGPGGSGDLLLTFGAADQVSGIVATVRPKPGDATQMFTFSALRGRACGDIPGVPSCTAKR